MNFYVKKTCKLEDTEALYSIYNAKTDGLILELQTRHGVTSFLYLNEPDHPAISSLEPREEASGQQLTFDFSGSAVRFNPSHHQDDWFFLSSSDSYGDHFSTPINSFGVPIDSEVQPPPIEEEEWDGLLQDYADNGDSSLY